MNPPRVFGLGQCCLDQCRILHRRCADHDTGHAQAQNVADTRHIAHAATELYFQPGGEHALQRG